MKYSSYERLFFPVTEVMFLVNPDLVEQKKKIPPASWIYTI